MRWLRKGGWLTDQLGGALGGVVADVDVLCYLVSITVDGGLDEKGSIRPSVRTGVLSSAMREKRAGREAAETALARPARATMENFILDGEWN